jgi:adenine-specific DNA methylase
LLNYLHSFIALVIAKVIFLCYNEKASVKSPQAPCTVAKGKGARICDEYYNRILE